MMKQFERLLWRLVDGTLVITITGMVVLIALQVCSRLAGSSLVWTEELSRFLFVWTIWLGMAAGFRHGLHPSLDLLVTIVPPMARRLLRLLQALAASVFLAVVCWYSVKLVQQQLLFREVSAILQIGKWLTSVPMILGSALAIIGVLMHSLTQIRATDGEAEPMEGST
ncbi:TRAP transporter small permease subunit [Halomonas cupida]|uniref:TRAP transporter small permease n=1 Tax=Halomonas cupida TaxID=44933 RepID=UPI0039B366BB